jgi:hypothetical protein
VNDLHAVETVTPSDELEPGRWVTDAELAVLVQARRTLRDIAKRCDDAAIAAASRPLAGGLLPRSLSRVAVTAEFADDAVFATLNTMRSYLYDEKINPHAVWEAV